MFISLLHTWMEMGLGLLFLRLLQLKLVKNYPESAATGAVSFLAGS